MNERTAVSQYPTKQTLANLYDTLTHIPKPPRDYREAVSRQFPYDSPEEFFLEHNFAPGVIFHQLDDGQFFLAWFLRGFGNRLPRAKIVMGTRTVVEGVDLFRKDTYELYRKRMDHYISFQEVADGKVDAQSTYALEAKASHLARDERKAGLSEMTDQEVRSFHLRLQTLKK